MGDACLVYWCWYEQWFDAIRGSKASSFRSFKHYLFEVQPRSLSSLMRTLSVHIVFKNSCSFPVSSNWYLLILKTRRRRPKYPSHLRFSSLIYQKRHLKSHLQQTTICNTWPNSFTLYYFYQEIISFQPVSSIRISLHSSVCFLFEQTVSLNLMFPVCLNGVLNPSNNSIYVW